MTVAAIDRLIHHGNIIELEEDSYRRKAAQKKNAKTHLITT
jgi:DNA replication protein DnaC